MATATFFTSGDASNAYHETFPVTEDFAIPDNFAGTFKISVLMTDGNGALAPALEVAFAVRPAESPSGITVYPEVVRLEDPGQSEVVEVIGHYTGGIDRTITVATAGTQYTTSDATVATVTSNGRVIAVGDGQCTITVQHGTTSVEVPVDVDHTRFECKTDDDCFIRSRCKRGVCVAGRCIIQDLPVPCDD